MDKIIGLIPTKITHLDDELKMEFSNGATARWYHSQDCCEDVHIHDINGDLQDLIGHPIIVAEERTNSSDPPLVEHEESYTWTFYCFRSLGGSVDVRWYGSSSGYYSESVDFTYTAPPQPEGFELFRKEVDEKFNSWTRKFN